MWPHAKQSSDSFFPDTTSSVLQKNISIFSSVPLENEKSWVQFPAEVSFVMKTTVEDIILFSKVLDGGPIVCGSCITAWRPTMPACPNCGCVLSGEQNTERARELYTLQRRDDAPEIRSSEWLTYLENHGITVTR